MNETNIPISTSTSLESQSSASAAIPVSVPAAVAAPVIKKIGYDDFAKVEITAGKILSAEKIPETEKLLKLSVDFNEKNAEGVSVPRQIVSGISMYFPDPAVLIGRICMFVTNLEPRKIKGYESNGMLFALSTPAAEEGKVGNFSLLEPNDSIPPGTKAC